LLRYIDRQQFVTINNETSNNCPISCGVPQGSVLGPLLFLLYINDFQNCSKLFEFTLFADDGNLFFEDNNLSSMEANINSELVNIDNWLCANKLSLNIEKSNYVIFHARQRTVRDNFNLSMMNQPLKRDTSIKYLGILIDSNLSWKSEVESIAKKIRRSVGIISKLRHYVNKKILLNLYYSLIYPFLIYGLLAWGNTYKTTLNPIHILQKKVIRIITFSKFDEHTSPLFKELKILKFPDLVTFHISIFMYKFHNNILPSIFESFFTRVDQVHNYRTRSSTSESYYIPKVRTNYGLFNIRYQGPTIWNSIPKEIRYASLSKFKNQFKNDYFQTY
jgi:hypothetical protein